MEIGEQRNAIGKIIKEEYKGEGFGNLGKYIMKWDEEYPVCWKITNEPCIEKTAFRGIVYKDPANTFKQPSFLPKEKRIISEKTVDHYVEIGTQQTGPDVNAMARGTFVGGAGLGLVAGAATATSITDVAFYMKDGNKFIARFTDAAGWQELKSALFVL